MINKKIGRPTISLKDYTVRVRLCKEEIQMLDTICFIDKKSRSDMIRELIVRSIRAEYATWANLDEDKHLNELFNQMNILEIYNEVVPLIDEIDKEKDDK